MAMRYRSVGRLEFEANVKKMVARLSGRSLVAALTVGAELLVNGWKERAPYETGTYRGSIHIGGITQPESGGLGMGWWGGSGHVAAREPLEPPVVSMHRAAITVGTDIVDPPYPQFLEDGTVHMAARPSAQPAFDEEQGHIATEVGEAVKVLVLRGAL